LVILDFLNAVAMQRKEINKEEGENVKMKMTQKKILAMSSKMMKHMRVLVNISTKTSMNKSIEANTTLNTKTNLKMMVNMNINMKINAVNMNQKANMRMNLKSKDNMNDHSRSRYAMVAKRLSGTWLCAVPYLVMSTAEVHLLTVSGDREEQREW
jgi:hypothetical protein